MRQMPTLAQLRAALNLPSGQGGKKTFGTPEEAAALLSDHAAAQVEGLGVLVNGIEEEDEGAEPIKGKESKEGEWDGR